MKTPFSLIFCICFVSLFSASAYSFDKAKLDKYLQTLEIHDKAMLSLAVVEDGKPIYQKAVGFVDVENKQKANKDTQYRIGSITKVFTATLIFQLIDEGKLSLDTKLARFYPKVKNADKITISMLLSHRSGIFNFTNDPEYLNYMEQPKTKAEMASLIESLDSDFEPDSQASYSNSAYVLLGYIIEDISKNTYAQQLQKSITSKLNLNRTQFGGTIELADNQAKSYIYSPQINQWSPATDTNMSIPHGAGAIISTPTEVATFLTNLLTGKLISQDSLAKMKEINQGYGRGLFQFPFNDKKAYGHTGGIDGFRSQSGYFEDDKLAFVLTSNGVNYSLNEVSIGLLSIYYDMPFDIPDFAQKAITLPESDLVKYEGIFASDAIPLKITLKVVEGQLTAQATGQGALNLTPYSKLEFRFAPAGIVMLFGEEDDTVNHSTFQLKQGGGSFTFIRQ